MIVTVVLIYSGNHEVLGYLHIFFSIFSFSFGVTLKFFFNIFVSSSKYIFSEFLCQM